MNSCGAFAPVFVNLAAAFWAGPAAPQHFFHAFRHADHRGHRSTSRTRLAGKSNPPMAFSFRQNPERHRSDQDYDDDTDEKRRVIRHGNIATRGCSGRASDWLLADLMAVVAVLIALFSAPLGGEPQAWGKIRRGLASNAEVDTGGCAGCSGQADSGRQHCRQQKHSHHVSSEWQAASRPIGAAPWRPLCPVLNQSSGDC